MHVVEAFLSQHPWWTLVLGMVLPGVGVLAGLLVAACLGSAARTPDPPLVVRADDAWGRIAARLTAASAQHGPRDVVSLALPMLASGVLTSDDGQSLEVELEWYRVCYLTSWSPSEEAALREAVQAERRGSVRFRARLAPGVEWVWAPQPTIPPHTVHNG